MNLHMIPQDHPVAPSEMLHRIESGSLAICANIGSAVTRANQWLHITTTAATAQHMQYCTRALTPVPSYHGVAPAFPYEHGRAFTLLL